jgi:hypothetical protein
VRIPSLLVSLSTITMLGCRSGASSVEGSDSAASDDTIEASNDAVPAAETAVVDSGIETTEGSTDAAAVAHVEVKEGSLRIDGSPTFLFGGDLHYFRVRAPDFDAAQTKAMWAASLDTMKAAGMNLVSTYVPWDYHNTAEGTWDWSGARDLNAFLTLACDRRMWVVLKPGPLITGEWPRGFGTFGAVPAWWKEKHQDALVRTAKGDLWSYSPTGDTSQRQPTYLHPAYLDAVRDYYTRVFAIARPFLGRCLVGVQVDNETNGYWGNRYGDVDYSDTSVAHFRSFLESKYGTLAALNVAWATSFASFSVAAPPTSAPGSDAGDRPKNKSYSDWYAGGQAYTLEYLHRLRAMIESLGFKEPDVLFLTNDSPFSLGYSDLLLRNVLLADGTIKNPIGLHGLDLYPKQFVTSGNLQDQPFQADYFTTLYAHWTDRARATGEFAYAAELQGGFYSAPVVGRPNVRPEATDQLLARTVGRGLKGGSFYVVRDGLNADNSKYDYAAAIDEHGNPTPRYAVMAKWGRLLGEHAASLMRATPVRNGVAIVVDGRYQAPQAGVLDDLQRLWANEAPALFGWLVHAGIEPAVLDARGVTSGELAAYPVVFFLNPDFVYEDTAQLLVDYADGGGMLVNLLWPGRVNDRFVPSAPTSRLSAEIFPAKAEGSWSWPNTGRSGTFNAKYGTTDGQSETFWYQSYWSQPAGVSIEPFGWERTQPLGSNGKVVGYVTHAGAKTRAFLGTSAWTRFNQSGYYSIDNAELSRARDLARWIVGLGGESPIVTTSKNRALAWARRDGATVWLFVVNDDASPATITVTFAQPKKLGLDPSKAFSYQDVLGGGAKGTASGALDVALPAFGTAVVKVDP